MRAVNLEGVMPAGGCPPQKYIGLSRLRSPHLPGLGGRGAGAGGGAGALTTSCCSALIFPFRPFTASHKVSVPSASICQISQAPPRFWSQLCFSHSPNART